MDCPSCDGVAMEITGTDGGLDVWTCPSCGWSETRHPTYRDLSGPYPGSPPEEEPTYCTHFWVWDMDTDTMEAYVVCGQCGTRRCPACEGKGCECCDASLSEPEPYEYRCPGCESSYRGLVTICPRCGNETMELLGDVAALLP